MGDPQAEAANQAIELDIRTGEQAYDLGMGGLKAGTSYLTSAYGAGGMDQSAKYAAMQTGVMEQNPYDAVARESAIGSVTSQKVLGGLDEMNRLRGMLAGQGLKTTGLAAQAAGERTAAIGGMAPWDKAGSTAKMVAGAASAAYGAYQDRPGQAPSSTLQPGAGSFFGSEYNMFG